VQKSSEKWLVEMYKNMKRKGDVVVRGEVGVREVENEEQMRKLIENVEEIKKKIEDFCDRKLNKWKSRKFIVVLVFGFAYPIMNHIGILQKRFISLFRIYWGNQQLI